LPSIPLKPQYGPTLGRLLAPRWHAARAFSRAAVVATGIVLLAVVVAAVLSLLDAGYSHGAPVPFSFRYRSLHRAPPLPGGYVRVLRGSGGRLRDSFEVAPLHVGPYRGSVTAELPLLASGYVRELRRRFPDFVLRGEGKTRITSTLAGYDVRYSALVDGARLHGRDVMLLPPGAHVREGVVLEMLTSEAASVAKPVASQGPLERPLKSFSFG
jgi:hypothetical protein